MDERKLSEEFIKTAPAGKHSDGRGLWLVVREDGGAQWVLRVTVFGKRREMGLGGWPTVTLSDARSKAEVSRRMAANGVDPIDRKKQTVRKHNFSHSVAKNEREALLDFVQSKAGWSPDVILAELTEILRA